MLMNPKKNTPGAPVGNTNARKGIYSRVQWCGRLPVETVEQLRALVSAGRVSSQSDAVAMAVSQLQTQKTHTKMKKQPIDYLRDALASDRCALKIFAEKNQVDARLMDDQTLTAIRMEAEAHEIRSAAGAGHYCSAIKPNEITEK